ncbi:glycosyltransferase family 4 protein [Marinilabiliaceae bacterium ANBcel2]|nr:glycosyltransferase family 4 protein [Marinilabiliaceae bacterium ANBcel2]
MRIVHVNRSDIKGGAAIAASRIVKSIKDLGFDTSFLVARKESFENIKTTVPVASNLYRKTLLQYYFAKELFYFIPKEKNRSARFAWSAAKYGFDISTHPLIQSADIIHLHWINQGYLSLTSLHKLFKLNKPVVWTLHDMWSFTGGCHYAGECDNYTIECGNCQFLKICKSDDLSFYHHRIKREIYLNINKIAFVPCSKWLAEKASNSSLIKDHQIKAIPNPIDIDIYRSLDKNHARRELGLPLNKKLVLFGAANISDGRKGFDLLIRSLQLLKKRGSYNEAELLLFGKTPSGVQNRLPLNAHIMGYISDKETLIKLFNAADIFALPSLEDNLPNTVMESLACGTPVVAFNTGGVPEMIDHKKSGYLARIADYYDFASGMEFLLSNSEELNMHVNARDTILEKYSPAVVAQKYIDLYSSLLSL